MKPAAILAALSITAMLGWQRLPPAHTDLQVCVWIGIVPICRDIAPKPKPKPEPIKPIKCHEETQ